MVQSMTKVDDVETIRSQLTDLNNDRMYLIVMGAVNEACK